MQFGKFFVPMLLTEKEHPFNSPDYLYELKFDGIRATIHVGPKEFIVYNRRGKDITDMYPELKNIQKTIKENMIFDGEIVLFDEGIPNFSKLQERSHLKNKAKIKYYSLNYSVCFIAFDCLYKNKSLANKTLLERKKVLEIIEDTDYFIKTKYILKKGKELYKKVQKLDLEGIVAKKIDSLYEIDTRSVYWIKIKNLKKEIFYIGGFVDNKQNAVVSLYLGEYKNKKFSFVGKVTMGKKKALYQKILNKNVQEKSPFCDYEDKKVKFISPTLICEVAYLERTNKNRLRQPIFIREINKRKGKN